MLTLSPDCVGEPRFLRYRHVEKAWEEEIRMARLIGYEKRQVVEDM